MATADIERLRARIAMLAEKGLGHTLKKLNGDKSKKRKKEKKGGQERAPKKEEDSITKTTTASLTSRVLEDEKIKSKRRKVEMSDNLKTLFSAKGENDILGKNDFMSRGYTIPGRR